MYDRTTVQGATFNMRGQLYRGHANATTLSSSPVISALDSESEFLFIAGARRCALETCEKKNMWAPLLGLARSIYYITYHLQSNWNTRRENWCKIKEMDCRRKHKCQRQCQLRMTPPPRKILPFYSHVSMTTVKNCNRENINSLVFLELQHITFLYSFLIGFSHI